MKKLLIISTLLILAGCGAESWEEKTIQNQDERIRKCEMSEQELEKISVLLEEKDLCWKDFEGNVTLNKETRCPFSPTDYAFDKVWCFEPVGCSFHFLRMWRSDEEELNID